MPANKSLLEHILANTFRPTLHLGKVNSDALPVVPPHSPASRSMSRSWAQILDLQAEISSTKSRPAQVELAQLLNRRIADYLEAVKHFALDPERDVPGLRELRERTHGPNVAAFFAKNFTHTKGPMAGKPFAFEDWQQHDINLIYELNADGTRRWRSVLWGVPRGNGKSPVVGGLGLVEVAVRDDEPNVFTAGVDRAGAGIIHAFQSSFVTGSGLREFCTVTRSRIDWHKTGGFVQTLSGDGYRAHGLSPSAALRDEKHAWITDRQIELHNALASAMHKRHDSVEIDITTAGWDLATLLGEQYEANLQQMDLDVLEDGFLIVGRDTESQSLMIWRGAPEYADPTDPVTWRRANPASWLQDSDLKRLAMTLPENVFRRLILNQWTESVSRWLPVGSWENRRVERTLERGEPIVMVFCGTYQRDSAALVASTLDDDEPHVAVLGLWEKPRDAEGWTVPAAEVQQAVRRSLRHYDVVSFICDKPGWEDETEEWDDEYAGVVSFPLETNRRKRMVAASARFVSRVAEGAVSHDGNAEMARQFAQVVAKDTPEGAVITRPQGSDKKPAAGKFIDGAVAAVLAVDEALSGEGLSVYETRGLVTM